MIIIQIILILLHVNDNMLEFPSSSVRFSRETNFKKTHRVWRFTMQISFWDFLPGPFSAKIAVPFVSVRVATSTLRPGCFGPLRSWKRPWGYKQARSAITTSRSFSTLGRNYLGLKLFAGINYSGMEYHIKSYLILWSKTNLLNHV